MIKGYNFILIVILKLVFVLNCFSQNLILNPKFDEYEVFYDNNGNIVYHPKNWFYNNDSKYHPFYFSTDRFLNEEVKHKIHPDGELIKQGDTINYIGLHVLPHSESFYSKLPESLIKSTTYELSIDVKVLGSHNCLTDMIVGFSEHNPDSSVIEKLILKLPDNLSIESEKDGWYNLRTKFMATGREKYLIIGTNDSKNYINIIKTDSLRYDRRQGSEYGVKKLEYRLDRFILKYGIDNVKLYESINFEVVFDSLKVNDSFVLNNILFEFEKATLNESSFPTLLKLFEYLKSNDTVKIEIQGHTDNVGTKEFNDTLSYERAESVRNYLVENGISENRISFIGFGYEKPISSNDTDSGRQLNRRVEIKLLEK